MVTCVNGVGDLVGLSVNGPALWLSSLVWLLTYINQASKQSYIHTYIHTKKKKQQGPQKG